jgi:hypothetical protein
MPTIADVFTRPEPVPPLPPSGPLPLHYRHRTLSGVSPELDNIMYPWYWTRLDHPALNGNPEAILTVTPVGRAEVNDQTATARLIHNPYPIGVLYRELDDR